MKIKMFNQVALISVFCRNVKPLKSPRERLHICFNAPELRKKTFLSFKKNVSV